MKKIALILLQLLASAVAAFAQNPVDILKAKLAEGRISMDYVYRTSGDVPVTGNGVLTIEGDCYRMEGNGILILCDGQCRWTADPGAKEVYIESSLGIGEFLSHPETIENSLSELNVGEKEISGKYGDSDSGIVYSFKISNIKAKPVSPDKSAFRFDCAALGTDWVVTDLR